MEKFSRKNWFLLLLFGIIGQIAWSVENMFFGTFVYNTFLDGNSEVFEFIKTFENKNIINDTVTLMIQLSGIVATVITLVAGTLSDKLGNRRTLLSVGYIIWGFTVAIFGCLTPEVLKTVLSQPITQVVTLSLTLFVVGDCVMTMFGSFSNDAAFNAWVTDNTKSSYRGYVETVFSILPLLGLLIVSALGLLVGIVGGYTPIFIGLGIVISICGVVGLFLFKDSPDLKKSGSFRDIVYGFRPSVIKKHLPFYATLLSVAIFGIAIQTFMGFLITYMEKCLNFNQIEYSIVFALAILCGAAVNLYLGKLSDKMSKSKLLYAAAIILSLGLFGMYFASMIVDTLPKLAEGETYTLAQKLPIMISFGIGGFFMICGNIFSTALNGAIMRDHTPEGAVGKMQGVRMVASVLIPMLIGPAIANELNKRLGGQQLTGIEALTSLYVPVREIFLAGAIIALLAILVVPLIRKAEQMVQKTEQ